MKVLRVKDKDYYVKFNTEVIAKLHAKGLTFMTLAKDMETLRLDRIYETLWYGLKTMQHDIELEDVYKLIDSHFDNEDSDLEDFLMEIMGEYSKAVGLGKKFKLLMDQRKTEKAVE